MERCPNCGASIRTGARFCTACGNRISQPVPAPAAADAPPVPVMADVPVQSAIPPDAQADQASFDGETVPEVSAPSHPVMADQPADGSAMADGWSDGAQHSDERAPDLEAASEPETAASEASAPNLITQTDASAAQPQRDDRYGWSTWSPTRDDAPNTVAPSTNEASRSTEDVADTLSVTADGSPEPHHAADGRIDEITESQPPSESAVGTEETSADSASIASEASTASHDDQDVIALPGPDDEVGPADAVTYVAEEPVQSLADELFGSDHPGLDPAESAATSDEVVQSRAIQDEPIGHPNHASVLEDVVGDESVIRSDGERDSAAWTAASSSDPSRSVQGDDAEDSVSSVRSEPEIISAETDSDGAANSVPVADAPDEVPVSAADADGSGPGADSDWEPWGQASDPDPTTDSTRLNQPDADPTRSNAIDDDSGGAVSDWSAGLWAVDGPDAGDGTPATTGTARSTDDPLGQVRRLVEELRIALDAASVAEPGHAVAGGAAASDVLQLLDGMPADPIDDGEIEALRVEAAALEDRDFDIRALQQFAHRRMLIGDLITAYLQQRDLLHQLRATIAPPDDSPAPTN